MFPSQDLSPKQGLPKESSSLISPSSKKKPLQKLQKTSQKQLKSLSKPKPKAVVKNLELKSLADPSASKKPQLKKNRSTKFSNIVSPKKAPKKLNFISQGLKLVKSSNRVKGNSSNRSLKLSLSPKSSYISLENIEYPLSPAKAISAFKSDLTTYEQGEILRYPEIYYVGTISNKIPPRIECENYGFDDSHTDYLLVKRDHIAYRYEILALLGKGSFGQVCECFDHKKKEKVALKIIKNKQKFHQQARIEVKVLCTLRENDPDDSKNIIRMKNFFSFRNHICITFELVSVNLYEFLRLNNFQGISLSLIRCFAKQILNALDYSKSLEIVHCDLKPENILLVNPQKASIKLIDFGSSCFIPERLHTYIQSRFYRAPEIILGIPYNCAIDMWSLGCILIEMFNGQPLWPGESEFDQLLYIISYLGLPPLEVLNVSTRKSLFFDGNSLKSHKLICGNTVAPASHTIESAMKGADSDLISFIENCFIWNPIKRMTPKEGLMHPWLKGQKSSKSLLMPNKLT